MDEERNFVTRQYASLIAGGMDDASARTQLGEVLGEAALRLLGDGAARAGDAHDAGNAAASVVATATRLGGNAGETHAALARALGEARVLALDWWRPIRTFLLYIAFLLSVAVVIAIIFAAHILPAFSELDATIALPAGEGGAWWAGHALRLFGPLVLIAVLLVILAIVWYRMRQRIAVLQPLAGADRFPWLYGRSGQAWRALLCLEFTSALRAGGVAAEAVLEPALKLARWPQGRPLETRGDALGRKLEQAQRLGTFDAELEWQRRLYWSHTQSRLDLGRDRLTLFSRVIFYILVGYMVTILYIPIFSIASLVGVHT